MEAALRAAQAVDHFRETVEVAGTYPLAEVGKHTAGASGECAVILLWMNDRSNVR